MEKQISTWQKTISVAGYVAANLLIPLHYAFWRRAEELHGYWGHLNEASRWLQTIDAASLCVIVLCLFGVGWKRWLGSTIGVISFALSCMYAIGL
jgi:hypothetical protein